MKKVYLLFLLALLPLFASAETVEINGIRYNVNPEAKTAEVKLLSEVGVDLPQSLSPTV